MKKIYWLIPLFLALGLRFARLNAVPLNSREAALAWQSLLVMQGARPLLAASTAYILPTAGVFWLFTAANWTARLWPALAGTSLVLLPWFLRRDLGERAAFFLALGFALDPFLTAASRSADGLILAAAAAAWGLLAFRRGRYFWAGVALALFFFSGISAWLLFSALAMTLLLLISLAYERVALTFQMGRYIWRASAYRMKRLAGGFLSLWGIFALAQRPALAAWLGALPAFGRGWLQSGALPPTLIFVGGLVWGLLPWGLAVFALSFLLYHRQKLLFWQMALGALALMLAFLIIFYPSHRPVDWAWVSLVLWPFSALWLDSSLPDRLHFALPEWGAMGLTLTLLGFEWLQMLAVLRAYGGEQAFSLGPWSFTLSEAAVQLSVWVVGWLILLVSLSLIALTWKTSAALRGFGAALALGALIYSLGMAWSAAGTRTADGVEFWQAEERLSTGLLAPTVAQIATYGQGEATSLDVVFFRMDDVPALRWALRDYHPREMTILDRQSPPPMLVSTLSEDLSAAAAYRGQVVTWRQIPYWQGLSATDWLRWAMLRRVPLSPDQRVLWVRADLFKDTQTLP